MAYIGKSPTGTGVRQRYYFTATGGETSLSGTDDNGLTLSYSDGAYVDVLLNGIELVAGTDYNTSTANTIAGLSALAANDIVTVTVYDIFTVADTVSAKDGGTFSGNVAMGGTLSVTGASTLTGDLTVDTDTLYVDSTNDRVGIGTTSPNRDLEISSTAPHVRLNDTDGGYAEMYGGQGYLDIHADRGNAVASSRMTFNVDGSEAMRIDFLGRPFIPAAYTYTTAASANMFVASSGQFFRSTSSNRYKNTINDATHGLTELLTLRPVTYKGNNDGDTIFGGLIAEEVHAAGLTEFVEYSQDDNGDDQPESIHYAHMVSLCIKSIQELKAKLDAAEARLTALENA